MRYRLVRTETVERKYECAHCKSTGETFVRARGESSWFRRSWFYSNDDEPEAHEDAAMSVQDDATRILGLVRCPTCGRRATGAVVWSMVRLAWSMLVVLAATSGFLVVSLMLWEWPGWTAFAIAALGIAIGAHNEWRRWGAARLARRALTKLRVAPEAPPVAIARIRPPTEPPQKIQPVRTEAPPREPAPPSSGEGPRFLRERQ